MIAAAAVLALAGTAGCGGDNSTAPTPDPTSSDAATSNGAGEVPNAAEGDVTIDIADFLYDPADVSVAAGTTVTWVNQDQASHTATADDSSFDTGTLQKADEAEATFDKPGTYSYYCRFHAFMHATIKVE